MIKNAFVVAVTACLFVCAQAIAESSGRGMRSLELDYKHIPTGRDMLTIYTATLSLPEFSDSEEQEILRLIEDARKFHTGIFRSVNVEERHWQAMGERSGFNIWQLHIYSPEAISLQVRFSDFALPDGMSVKVYPASDKVTHYAGEYTNANMMGLHRFSSLAADGDTVVVEAWIPTDDDLTPANFPFAIDGVWHRFRDADNTARGVKSFSIREKTQTDCPRQGARCNFAINDLETWRGIGRMRVGSASCSGTLINPGNNELYFMTAYHCIEDAISGPEAASGTTIPAVIEYGVSPCAPSGGPIADSSAARYIAGHADGDYALLSIPNSAVTARSGRGGLLLLGWSTERHERGAALEALHHGDSDPLQHAQAEIAGYSLLRDISRQFFEVASCSGGGCSHYELHLDVGGISGGASGSGWFRMARLSSTQDAFVFGGVSSASADECDVSASLFDKIFEDGRVRCAISSTEPSCDTSSRPSYFNAAIANRGGGGGGGGGGVMGLSFLFFVFLLALSAHFATRRRA